MPTPRWEIIAKSVLENLGPAAAGYNETGVLKEAKQVQDDLARSYLLLQSNTTITTVPAQAEYDIPEGVFRIKLITKPISGTDNPSTPVNVGIRTLVVAVVAGAQSFTYQDQNGNASPLDTDDYYLRADFYDTDGLWVMDITPSAQDRDGFTITIPATGKLKYLAIGQAPVSTLPPSVWPVSFLFKGEDSSSFLTTWNDQLIFDPPPSAVETLTLWTYILPTTEPEITGNPDLKDEWDDALIFGLTARLLDKVPGEDARAERWDAKFERECRRQSHTQMKTPLMGPHMVDHSSKRLGF